MVFQQAISCFLVDGHHYFGTLCPYVHCRRMDSHLRCRTITKSNH